MADEKSGEYQIWTMRISLATTLIVVVLSWLNTVRTLDIMVRSVVSFGVMYLLMSGIHSLFQMTADSKTNSSPQSKPQISMDTSRGGVIDFSVGDDDDLSPQLQESNFPGQVDPSLGEGLPGSKQQADIVRRMGWD